MADPFSVAGGVVGVVTLAITACQGVISYYNTWETQDQNISDAKGKIERLQNSLSALKDVLPKISSSSAIAQHVEQCVRCCEEGTSRLEHFLGKCRKNPAPVSLRDKIRVCRQQALFPFRESSLDSLGQIVQDLERNLGTALQVLQLYVAFFVLRLLLSMRYHPNCVSTSDTSEAQFKQTSDLIDLTKSTAVSVSDASQNISNIEHKVNTVVGVLPQIQECVARFTSDVPIPHSSYTSMQQNMEQRLQTIESLMSKILPDVQSKLDILPLRIAERLADSSALTELRAPVETSGLNVIKSAISTTLTDMVVLKTVIKSSSANDLSGRGRAKASTCSGSEAQLTTECLR